MAAKLTAAVLALAASLAPERALPCERPKPDARVKIRFLHNASLAELVHDAERSSCVEYRFEPPLRRRMLMEPVEIEVAAADLDAIYAIIFHSMNLAVEGSGPSRKLVATGPETEPSKALVRFEDQITKIDDRHFRITRRGVDMALGNMAQLARSARIVPETRNGKPAGFRLFSLKSESMFEHLGFRNLDVIRSMNDIEMTSPDNALLAYTKMKTANKVRFGMERNGTPFTLEVEILGPPPRAAAAPAPPPPGRSTPRRSTFTRAELDGAFHHVRLLMLPSSRAGKPDGVVLVSLNNAGPVLEAAGFLNGDRVDAVNGRPVTTPESFLQAYDAAVKTNRIEFSLVRFNGGPKTLVLGVK